jgi:hypothetical protein
VSAQSFNWFATKVPFNSLACINSYWSSFFNKLDATASLSCVAKGILAHRHRREGVEYARIKLDVILGHRRYHIRANVLVAHIVLMAANYCFCATIISKVRFSWVIDCAWTSNWGIYWFYAGDFILDFKACEWKARSLFAVYYWISISVGYFNFIRWRVWIVRNRNLDLDHVNRASVHLVLARRNANSVIHSSLFWALTIAFGADILFIWAYCVLKILFSSLEEDRNSTNILSERVVLNYCGNYRKFLTIIVIGCFIVFDYRQCVELTLVCNKGWSVSAITKVHSCNTSFDCASPSRN